MWVFTDISETTVTRDLRDSHEISTDTDIPDGILLEVTAHAM